MRLLLYGTCVERVSNSDIPLGDGECLSFDIVLVSFLPLYARACTLNSA
jgi:hypothetical protein